MQAKLAARLKKQLEESAMMHLEESATKYVEIKKVYAPKPSIVWFRWKQVIKAMELQAATAQARISVPPAKTSPWTGIVAYYVRDAEDALRAVMERHEESKARRGPAYWLSPDWQAGDQIQANDTKGSSGYYSTQPQQQQLLLNTSAIQSVAAALGEPTTVHGSHAEPQRGQDQDTPQAVRIAREVNGLFTSLNRGPQQLAKAQAARSARQASRSKSPASPILRRNPKHAQPIRKLRQATQTKL